MRSRNTSARSIEPAISWVHVCPARETTRAPDATKRRLGLDDARCWVVLTKANRFVWLGPDLVPSTPGDSSSVAYGLLPYALFENIRLAFIDALKARVTRTVPRTE
jgi:hypothetical protein